MVEGTGIEVKIKGSLTEVTRQVHRYAQSEQVESLILITARGSHRGLPREMNGKRVIVIYLNPL